MADRDAWISKPQTTPEMCRLIHGVDCRKCWPGFSSLDKLVALEAIGNADEWNRKYEERQERMQRIERAFDRMLSDAERGAGR